MICQTQRNDLAGKFFHGLFFDDAQYGQGQGVGAAYGAGAVAAGADVVAAFVLFVVSGLMILLGGFYSPWTWVYVVSYFTLVHSIFILIAVWALVRAWSGDRLLKSS